MNSRTWSFYSLATGLFTGRTYGGTADHLAVNTRDGESAIEGTHDPLKSCVDLHTGQVVAYRPEAPADTEVNTWAWSDVMRRHVPVLTLLGQRLELVQRITVRIAELEGTTDRALRDLVLAGAPGAAQDRMQRIEDSVNPLRRLIDAALVAEDRAALLNVEQEAFPP